MSMDFGQYKENPATNYLVDFLENPHSLSQLECHFRYDLLNCMKQSVLVTITFAGNHPNPYAVKLRKYVRSLQEGQHLPFLTLLLWYSVSTILLYPLFDTNGFQNRTFEKQYNCSWFHTFMSTIDMEPYIENEDHMELVYIALDVISQLNTDIQEPDATEKGFIMNLYSQLLKIVLLRKNRIKRFTEEIREELLSVVLHPDRIQYLIETYGMGVLEWGV
jgi:hypothetical protein